MANYSFLFGLALVVNAVLTFRSSGLYKRLTGSTGGSSDEGNAEAQKRHAVLLKKYLFVYLLATFSDWLQGPYVYALYGAYGFQKSEIAELFVAGFGSSMIFGSFIGGMADWGGRKAFVVLFSIIYAASCMTKHFKHYGILMLGRLLGGVATSLLFSVFEAWLIRSHADADLPKSFLSKSFSWAQYGNSTVAILAGLVSQQVADMFAFQPIAGSETVWFGGYLGPFDLALFALICCGLGATFLWEENYGDSPQDDGGSSKNEGREAKWYDGMRQALTVTLRNRSIFLCGMISSLFEGSMYIFVFMWTPLLQAFPASDQEMGRRALGGDTSSGRNLPFGIIFATFMVSCMAGSSLFSILVEKMPVERMAIGVFCVASFSMATIYLAISETASFGAMLIFESCVGLYFPIMGTMKGGIVPEDKRAAIYNLYRVPLNFIVLFSLLGNLAATTAFALNAIMLSVATVMQVFLAKLRSESSGGFGQVKTPEKDIETADDSETEPLASSN